MHNRLNVVQPPPPMAEGCPFQDYQSQVRFLKGNMKRRKDNFTVAHGPEGVGKSTVLMNLAMDLQPDFDPVRNAIFGVDDLLTAILNGKEGDVFLVDEGANVFYNRDWNTVENKELTRIQRQARILRATWLIAMPDYDGLDPYLRNHRTFTRIYCEPHFDSDGMVPGAARVLWRQEWFDYGEQRVVHRWQDVYDLEVPSLDDHPLWQSYERLKRQKVHDQARDLQKRLRLDAERAEARAAKHEGRPKKKAKAPLVTT